MFIYTQYWYILVIGNTMTCWGWEIWRIFCTAYSHGYTLMGFYSTKKLEEVRLKGKNEGNFGLIFGYNNLDLTPLPPKFYTRFTLNSERSNFDLKKAENRRKAGNSHAWHNQNIDERPSVIRWIYVTNVPVEGSIISAISSRCRRPSCAGHWIFGGHFSDIGKW